MEKDLEKIIKNRKSTRNFASEFPAEEDIRKILESAIYAPFGGATGIPLHQIRKLYVFRQNSDSMEQTRELIYSRIKKNAKMFRIIHFSLS